MNNFKHLRNVLKKQLNVLSNSSSLFTESAVDFSRNRKLSFKDVMMSIISMEAGSLKDELLKLNNYSPTTPTASAFVQARSKIKVDAFKTLFNQFNSKTMQVKTLKGYRLLAIDGSELPIANTIPDEETTLLKANQNNKTYSAFHLNASYDLLECAYDDLIIQGQNQMDENGAFCDLVDSYKGPKAIFISDRGYESYNGFAHVDKSKNKYLVRIKDVHSKTSMARSLGPYPNEEFDIDVHRILTRRNTNEIKSHPETYKFCPANMRFDSMDKENTTYDFKCRIVRFKISDDNYETIVTNLSRDEFDSSAIKRLYHLRWGIETSFRELKYAAGLSSLHAKKRQLIKQEIYARMLLYNFSQRMINTVEIKRKNQKYQYQINYTRAIHIIREFIKKKTDEFSSVDNLIAKEILPIRPGRTDKRQLHHKTVVCFNYRFD